MEDTPWAREVFIRQDARMQLASALVKTWNARQIKFESESGCRLFPAQLLADGCRNSCAGHHCPLRSVHCAG